MKMKKFIAVLSVATMAAGLAVGCGSADSGSSDDKSSKGDWDSSNDITIVSREDGSGTRGAFIELFGIEEKKDGEKVDMTTDDAQITNSTSVMLTTVAGDDYAIGYVSLGSLNDTVKALKIDGEEATEQNIKDGKYKICRPFNIATKKGADNEVVKDFIAYIMSKEGQQVISDNGYIGDDSAAADAEILAMTVECLKAAGLTEFQVSVGQVDYYKSLLAEADLEPEMEEHLRELISQKNYFGVEELLKGQSLSESLSEAFAELPQMFGSAEVLEKAKKLTTNPEALAAVKRLEEIYEILKVYGCEKYVAFDFGMLSKFRYYTGIIFQAYTYGTGEPLVKGGRYNELMKHFGKPASSIGFAIVVDNLMLALSRQKLTVPVDDKAVVITYGPEELKEAIREAMKLRKEGKNVALRPAKEEQD